MPITQRVGACPAQLDSEEIHCRYSIRSVVPPNHNFRWAVSATATTFAASVPDFNFSRTCHSLNVQHSDLCKQDSTGNCDPYTTAEAGQ